VPGVVCHGSGITYRVSRIAWGLVRVAGCVWLLAACAFPGSVKPTIKIGLSAPFEGLYRDLGYEALHAVRLAVRQRNEAGGVGGRYLIELVALNDFNEPEEAARQAREMGVDPGILGVLGGWSPEAAHAAAPEYERLGLAFLAPEADFTSVQSSPPVEDVFAAEYRALSGGAPPGQAAVWAYAEANRLLDALDAAVRAERHPTRAGVLAALVTDN
jgi:Periplasmic binding protein